MTHTNMQMGANTANMQIGDDRVIERALSYTLNGIFFAVHNRLGRHCSEQQYCDAIAQFLDEQGVRYEREKVLAVSFPGEQRGRNRLDFLIDERIIVEVKAIVAITREDYAQVLRYLHATGCKLGILVNFAAKSVVPRRIINARV